MASLSNHSDDCLLPPPFLFNSDNYSTMMRLTSSFVIIDASFCKEDKDWFVGGGGGGGRGSNAQTPLWTKVEGYDLDSMWKYINGHNLNKVHNSLIGIKAQTNILINKMFAPFINRIASIQTMDAIFSVA
jgi:hypothetical protein